MKNSAFFILAFLLIRNVQQVQSIKLSPLQIESTLDQVHDLLHVLEKVNGFSAAGLSSLPDMKKMLEIVEKIPL